MCKNREMDNQPFRHREREDKKQGEAKGGERQSRRGRKMRNREAEMNKDAI